MLKPLEEDDKCGCILRMLCEIIGVSVKFEPKETVKKGDVMTEKERVSHHLLVHLLYLHGASLESRLPVFIVMASVKSTSLAGEASASLWEREG